MRGGLRLADRGIIPRLLSAVFRRAKKVTKDSAGKTTVRVALSYYEIYNDRVYDLLTPPDKRTPAGLPLREKDGKTVVVGLQERECADLKDFEKLYIEANQHRVTAATKLNAHSSRSHAILRVQITQTTSDMVLESVASAIDLAGAEDNRRTENDKTRMVESAAINKSLFVLSQCIDAIVKGEQRVPYRESKMTRILGLGQNQGVTVMILNLAPVRKYHLDTLSSLNVGCRVKRIEVKEVKNESVFKAPKELTRGRQPLKPIMNAHNVATGAMVGKEKEKGKPERLFNVYVDKKPAPTATTTARQNSTAVLGARLPLAPKRPSDEPLTLSSHPVKSARRALAPKHTASSRQHQQHITVTVTPSELEALVEKKVAEVLASRQLHSPLETQVQLSEDVRRRLEVLERKVEEEAAKKDGAERAKGLRYLLNAKQAKECGDEVTALGWYEKALAVFPGEGRLVGKIERLRAKLGLPSLFEEEERAAEREKKLRRKKLEEEDEYQDWMDVDAPENSIEPRKSRTQKAPSKNTETSKFVVPDKENQPWPLPSDYTADCPPSPRTQQLLDIINSRDVARIKGLHGFGAKKAQDLVTAMNTYKGEESVKSLEEVRKLPGVGRVVERAYEGLAV